MSAKINYLVKDELIYELMLRGISIQSDQCVDNLRKQLREHFNVELNVRNLSDKTDRETELDLYNSKSNSVEISLHDNYCSKYSFANLDMKIS